MNLHFDPRLAEDVVGAVLARQPMLAVRYRAEVNALYEDTPLDERESAFARLHLQWFAALELDRPLHTIFDEFPTVTSTVAEAFVARADRGRDEGAIFAVRSGRLGLRLSTRRFLDADGLSRWMRHELTHVADMLDPAFGYPEHPPTGATAGENLIRDRYRLLWDLSVDGRLARAKRKSIADATVRRGELDAVYRSLSDTARRAIFDRLWGASEVTHDQLWSMASDTGALLAFAGVSAMGSKAGGPLPGARCPLCKFPTYAWSPPLDAPVVAFLQADFPGWQLESGVCDRCAELYRMRAQSIVLRPSSFVSVE